MSYTCRRIAASPDQVFAFLADPTSYPLGSTFDHLVGVKPFVVPDSTKVLEVEPGRSLKLHVQARPFVSAIVTFTITGGPNDSVICMEEEPAPRLVGNIVRPLLDPVIHVRNHRSLLRLARLIHHEVNAVSPRP